MIESRSSKLGIATYLTSVISALRRNLSLGPTPTWALVETWWRGRESRKGGGSVISHLRISTPWRFKSPVETEEPRLWQNTLF